MGKLDKPGCIRLLKEKSDALNGERLPKRSDFSEDEVVAIKAFLGPWPRALEAAGLKAPRSFERIEKNRLKRAAAKEKRKNQKKEGFSE